MWNPSSKWSQITPSVVLFHSFLVILEIKFTLKKLFSDLSRHAENLFQELSLEANNFTDRARELEERVVDLSQRLSIDRNNNTELQLRNRDIQFDRYIMARDTIPQSLKEVYDTADAPPALEKLQVRSVLAGQA